MKLFNYKYTGITGAGIVLFLIALFTNSCEHEVKRWTKESEELQIKEYVFSNDSIYSEFNKALDIGNMSSLLYTRGPYTLFLPDNDAMLAFYGQKGVKSIEDFEPGYVRDLVLNHLISGIFISIEMPLGSLPAPNALKDYLVTEFIESDIIINKKSKITDRDIMVANGIIHRINRVIDIVNESCFDVLSENNVFSIFTQGLERTGISDTLKVLSVPYGKGEARVRYTILAVPDSVYAKDSIYSIDDLIARFDDGNGELNEIDNGFFKYMEYHCLEGTYYTSSFVTSAYHIISRENVVNLRVDSEFRINMDPITKAFTGFIIEGANIPAKNGVIHSIDGVLEYINPIPAPFIFQVTDFPDVRALDCYQSYIQNFFDGENTFANIKWRGADYLQMYYKTSEPLMDFDCIVMSDGYWELEITMPKIRKGNYQVYGNFKKGNNRANVIMYIDNVRVPDIIELKFESLQYELIYITDVFWDKTEGHVIKIKTLDPGIIMWDYLRFTPIKTK